MDQHGLYARPTFDDKQVIPFNQLTTLLFTLDVCLFIVVSCVYMLPEPKMIVHFI